MKKINLLDSINSPIITEKATVLSEQNKTVFKVHKNANKKIIKKNIEKLFVIYFWGKYFIWHIYSVRWLTRNFEFLILKKPTLIAL